jgi:ABC-type glycerol-3-phosphate transport system substrate-binding protein
MERRRFLKVMGIGALAGLPLLQACASTPAPSQTAPAKPAEGAAAKPADSSAAKPAADAKPAAPAQSAPAKTGAVREVSFMSTGTEVDQTMFKEAVDTVQKNTLDALNIKVNFQPGPSGNGAWEKVMAMFAANQAFDVQRIDDDRVFLLAVENKIHQLDNWMIEHKMKKEDYYPAFWTTLAIEGYQYAINPAGSANVVYYNMDLFEQAGVKAPASWKDAWGWEEALANIKKLSKVSGSTTDVYGLAFPPNISTPTGYGAGATAFNEDETQSGFSNPAVFDALDPLIQMVTKEKIIGPPELDDAGRLQLFNAGKIAMTWEAMGFDRQISSNIKWGIMPWMKTPKYAMTENYDRTFVISKSAKDPEAAFLTMKALSEKAASDVFAKHRFGLPFFKATAEGPIVNDESKPPANKNLWRETFDVIDGHPVDVPTPRSPAGEVWKQSFTDELFESALAGQISTKDFLDQANARINAKIAELGWKKGKGLDMLQAGGGLTHPDKKIWP